MKVLKTISIWVLISCILGCYYDVEENLYPSIDCDSQEMSYEDDIQPIVNKYCLVCHSKEVNFGNITLEEYEEITKYIDSGEMQGAINHEDGYSPMPKNGAPLLDCEIEKIESWINDGALDN